MRSNISLEEARDILMEKKVQTEAIHVPLMDSLGSVLAEDIQSDMNMPPFDKSPLDGYAIRGEDTVEATKDKPLTMEVIEFLPAGHVSDKSVGKNQAIRIMTGSKIPKGADTVVKFEDTDFTETEVSFYQSYKPGSNISLKGEDIEVGDQILKKGQEIDAPEIGILATLGKSYVKVYRKPRIAILSTGDELTDIHEPLQDGKIRNSNTYTLAAQIKKIGGKPLMLGVCDDTVETISSKILSAIHWADMVITTGGVSVGDCDLVKEAFQHAGAKMLFWRVRMKPGTPIAVAEYNNKLLFGLSGNPAAAYITFEQFVRPVILRQLGKEKTQLMEVDSILENDFLKTSSQNRFVRAKTHYRDGKYYTRFPGKHSSGVLSSLSGTNSLFYVPGGEGPFVKGDQVKVQLLDHPEVIK